MDAKNVAKRHVVALGFATGNARAVFESRKDGTVRVTYSRTIEHAEANELCRKLNRANKKALATNQSEEN